MCGICGIVGDKVSDNISRDMLDAIHHRGPDDEGVFYLRAGFLGHKRLSILDLSEAGHQPMVYGSLTIVFNGEIYNYIELREALSDLGHVFTTGTDTEVILHAYGQWGRECFIKFRGMWALAIYDEARDEIVLSRDRFGIKPLYYVLRDKALYFASEISALLAAGIKALPNMDRVVAYLMVGISDTEQDTFFEGIEQLPGGENLFFNLSTGIGVKEKFYNLYDAVNSAEDTDYEREFYRTVRWHLRSDVKIGGCLSGGLDSSTLAAAAQRELDKQGLRKMTVVTAKSEDANNDEAAYAQMVVDHCGLNWQLAYPKYSDFVAYHREMLRMQGEPVGSASVFMQFWVMKKAKELGIKVMLDGQGGDETLLGYERYYVNYLLKLLKKGKIGDWLENYKMIANNSKLTMKTLFYYYVYFSFWQVRRLYLEKRMKMVKNDLQERFFYVYRDRLEQDLDVRRMQITEIVKGHLSTLLRYEDRSSMYFHIETRVPYVDHVLVEKAVKLDVREKIKGGWTKYCLRKIANKILPAEIAWRKNKYGFEAPEKIWLNEYVDEMQKMVEKSDLLRRVLKEIPRLRELQLRERWRMYNLAVWEQDYLQ